MPLSRFAAEAFRRRRSLQAQEKLAAGGAYVDEGAVFATELGRRITPMMATCAYERIAKKAGIASMRLHDARHMSATNLLVGGTDVRTTAGVLGHSNANITLMTYAHLLVDAQQMAIDRLGDGLEQLLNRPK